MRLIASVPVFQDAPALMMLSAGHTYGSNPTSVSATAFRCLDSNQKLKVNDLL